MNCSKAFVLIMSLKVQHCSNGQSFTIGLRSTVFPTWTSTTRTLLSFPGNTLTILPKGHFPLGVSGDMTMTTSPTFRSTCSLRHFFRTLRLGIHSCNHLCQKWRTSSWTRRHLFLGLNTSVSTLSGANLPPNWPCKKWLGVKGVRSVGISSDPPFHFLA